MSKRLSMIVIGLVTILLFAPIGTAFANVADGTYDVPYEMKEANSDNTSIANGYFQSPATVTVNGDQATVQFTVTGADMVQSVGVSGSSISVIGEGDDTRTYEFNTSVANLKEPITMDMHIIVPEGTPGMEAGYNQEHQARAVFDTSGLPEAGSSEPETIEGVGESTGEGTSAEGETAEDNPQTGVSSPMMLYGVLIVGSAISLIAIKRIRTVRN